MSVLMVLWCNLHTGFTSGLIVLVLYVVFGSLQWVLTKRRGASPYLTACVTLFSTLLATLINPIGIGLWQYLPRLFFGQFNKTIVELQPLGLNDLKKSGLVPVLFPCAGCPASRLASLSPRSANKPGVALFFCAHCSSRLSRFFLSAFDPL